MYRSGTVNLLCCEGFFLLLAILCSRYELVVTNVAEISRSSRNITTLVNATEVLPMKNCSGLETCVIEFSHFQVPSDKTKSNIFNGRLNDIYNSTHFVNTSADPAYLVITGVKLQHAGTYTFGKLEGGFFGSIDLSVYDTPACRVEEDRWLMCNIQYAGWISPGLTCSYKTSHGEQTAEQQFKFEIEYNGATYFSIHSLKTEIESNIMTLRCNLSPPLNSSGEDYWEFIYQRNKSGFPVPVLSSNDSKNIPSTMIIVASTVGVIVLLANIILFSINVMRQKRSQRRNTESNYQESNTLPGISTSTYEATTLSRGQQAPSLEHSGENEYEHIPEIARNPYTALTNAKGRGSCDSTPYAHYHSINDSTSSDEKEELSLPLMSGPEDYLTMLDTRKSSTSGDDTGCNKIGSVSYQALSEAIADHGYIGLHVNVT